MKINKIDKEILEILNEARENRSGLYEGKADLFLVLKEKYRTTTVSVKVDMDHPDFDGVEKELQRNGFEDTGRVDNGKTYWKKEKLHKFYDNPTSEDIKKAKEKIRKETEENIIYRGVLN